jgi:hypothetical protein
VFWRTTVADRNLSSASQAGLVSNLNDGMAWGLLPVLFAASAGLDLAQIGLLAALYPATWGIGQLATGLLADRAGRKPLIVSGMWVQAGAIGIIALSQGFGGFAAGAVLLGIGKALVYPTLLAAIGDVAHPSWRASAVGVYRLWRDLGYAAGAHDRDSALEGRGDMARQIDSDTLRRWLDEQRPVTVLACQRAIPRNWRPAATGAPSPERAGCYAGADVPRAAATLVASSRPALPSASRDGL